MRQGTTRLQRRIAVALTVVVTLFILVQGLLAYRALEQQEDDLVDEVVASEGRRLMDRLAAGRPVLGADGQVTDLSPRFRAWLVRPEAHDLDSGLALGRLPDGIGALSDGAHQRHEGDRVLHYLVAATPGGRLLLEYDASADEAFVYRFGNYLVMTGAFFIALGALGSLQIARIVVAPFRRLAVQMAQWSPSHRPPMVGRSDEEALLLQAFDGAQRRLEEAHAREREFAENVRHEVRTPLTALRTDAEMLLATQPIDQEGRSRLVRMQSVVDQIAADIESLHHLSRTVPMAPEPVDLGACIDGIWLGLQHLDGFDRIELRNRIEPGERLMVDRLALMTILRNLLRNCIEHASAGRCEVALFEGGVTVSDDGAGIAPDDLPRIFDRHFRRRGVDSPDDGHADEGGDGVDEGDGRGLGLAIARQVAQAQGWQLTASSRPGDGSRFTLAFDEM